MTTEVVTALLPDSSTLEYAVVLVKQSLLAHAAKAYEQPSPATERQRCNVHITASKTST